MSAEALSPRQFSGTLFHGTRYRLKPGTIMTPEAAPRANQGAGTKGDHVYATGDAHIARKFAEYAYGPDGKEDAKPRVYHVEPTSALEADPDERPEAQSYRARSFQVVKEVGWASKLPPR